MFMPFLRYIYVVYAAYARFYYILRIFCDICGNPYIWGISPENNILLSCICEMQNIMRDTPLPRIISNLIKFSAY